MQKKKVFINQEDTINNNLKSSIVIDDKERKNNFSGECVLDKIDELISRNGYVFNVPVKIVTKDKTYETNIAGKVNNHLITLDNEIIAIKDIIDFDIKE